MTLMACYGGPPHRYHPDIPRTNCVDNDKDGSCAPADCNDHDPKVSPTAADAPGDGIDQNCDGQDGLATGANTRAPASIAVDE